MNRQRHYSHSACCYGIQRQRCFYAPIQLCLYIPSIMSSKAQLNLLRPMSVERARERKSIGWAKGLQGDRKEEKYGINEKINKTEKCFYKNN